MRLLIVSKNGLAVNLANIIARKNKNVNIKIFIEDPKSKKCLDGFVEKTKDWKKELDWVGKDGLIIFDDSGYGKEQDKLRKLGYKVFGGSALADKLEYDREFSQNIFTRYKIKTSPLKSFNSPKEALAYAKKNPKAWVIKREKDFSKVISFVGEDKQGRDVINKLERYVLDPILNKQKISLQEKVIGLEIGIGRFFNGENWVGPIEYFFEHPHLFPGDIGPMTSEMGTLAWYKENENEYFFKNSLEKIKPFLKEINFRGNMAINGIVNRDGFFALEFTPRMGTPIVHLQSEMFLSPWEDLLEAVATGKDFNVKYKKGFGIVMLLALPPFPWYPLFESDLMNGTKIDLSRLTEKDLEHVHFEEVAKITKKSSSDIFVANCQGYPLYVTSEAKSIEEANKKAVGLAEKIKLPKSFYRNDIGLACLDKISQLRILVKKLDRCSGESFI